MSHPVRVGVLFIAGLALGATGVLANVPDPDLSQVPSVATLSPTDESAPTIQQNFTLFEFVVVVEGQGGPVPNALVEFEFSPDAERLIAWCDGETHPIKTATSNANGEAKFTFQGGGCIELDDYNGPTFIWQVRADGIVLQEGEVNSPDAVNSRGRTATDDDFPPCEEESPGSGVWRTQAGLSDAVYHTRPIKLGLPNLCTKFVPPFHDPVALADSILLTSYIKNSGTCITSLWCSQL